MRKILISIFMLSIAFVLFQCSEDPTSTKDSKIKAFIEEGWENYSAQDFSAAELNFESAIELDAERAEAWSGLGWCKAKQNVPQEAVTSWQSGIELDPEHSDILAGLTIVYQAEDALEDCVQNGMKLFQIQNTYQFTHDSSVNDALLRGVMAAAYYGLDDFTQAAAQMDKAKPSNAPHSSENLETLLIAIMDFLGFE